MSLTRHSDTDFTNYVKHGRRDEKAGIARLGLALPGRGARLPCALMAPGRRRGQCALRTEGPRGLFCPPWGPALPRLSPVRKPVHSHDSSLHHGCCTTFSRQRGSSGHGAPRRWRGSSRGTGQHRPADCCTLLPRLLTTRNPPRTDAPLCVLGCGGVPVLPCPVSLAEAKAARAHLCSNSSGCPSTQNALDILSGANSAA